MSFFEEEPPTRRTATPPRRRAGATAAGGGEGGGAGRGRTGGSGGSDQTLLVRRGVAIAGAIVLFVLLALVVNACRGNARENALKDYNREASSIGRDSETQVGQPFFALFSGQASNSPTDLQTQVASLRVEAEKQFERAEALDVPDDMVPAQRSLLILLELRRDGLDLIGQRVRPALGDNGDAADEATQSITGQMQSFLASDVLHRARVVPLITGALNEAEIGGQEIATSRFVPSPEWLQPAFVSDRLGGGGGGGSGSGSSAADDEPEPGTHGTGLESVSVGEKALTPDGSNRIAAGGTPTFDVRFANQGENDEQDVRVDVTVEGESGGALRGSDTIDSVAKGASATASVRLNRNPPTGEALTITVRVRAVPGEEMEENNTQKYQALFE